MNYIEMADEFLKLWFTFQSRRPKKKMDEFMRGEGMILQCVVQTGGNILPSELSAYTDISTARTAATLNALEQKGLITRQIDSKDRRQIRVNPTGAGIAKAKQQQKMVLDIVAHMLSQLGEQDAKEYVRITKKISEMIPEEDDRENHTTDT